MKLLLTTLNVSLIESARIALEAEEIGYDITNYNALAVPFQPILLSVADDAHYERALAIVRGLETTPPGVGPAATPRAKARRGLRLALLALALAFVFTCVELW